MKTVIQTERSKLNIYDVNEVITDTNIVKLCVDEVKDKLIVNPGIIVCDKPCIQHRSIGFFSNESRGYYYSNKLAPSIPLSHNLKKLLEAVNKYFSGNYNGILVNRYSNGTDYIGSHSDDESNLGNSGVIAISYGVERNFRIRDKKTKKIVENIPTKSNSIIQMAGDFQKEFKHEIPIQKKILGERYSFTFRYHKN